MRVGYLCLDRESGKEGEVMMNKILSLKEDWSKSWACYRGVRRIERAYLDHSSFRSITLEYVFLFHSEVDADM